MGQSTPFDPGLQQARCEKPCLYCGARLELLVTSQPGHDETQQYICPECGKHYKIPAAMEPEVRVLSRRTDGKNGNYQETMF